MSQQVFNFTGNGTTPSFTLPATPIGLVQVFINGLLQVGGYSIFQNIITFNPLVPNNAQGAVIFWNAPQPPIPITPVPGMGSSALINVAEVVNSPEFAQEFILNRTEGGWLNGKWNPTGKLNSLLQYYGVIEVGTPKDIDMTMEADVIKGAITIWSELPIYTTHDGTTPGSSDQIQWHNQFYRVLQVSQWRDFGYYRAVATRLKAA